MPSVWPWSACHVFSELEPDLAKQYADAVSLQAFAAGDEIVRSSDRGERVFGLLSGSAFVLALAADGRLVGYRPVSAGDLFGELAVLTGLPRIASVVATTNCATMSISATVFKALVHSSPSASDALMVSLARNLIETSNRLLQLATISVRGRIIGEIIRIFVSSARPANDALVVEPAPTHEQIAAAVAVNREAVTREMRRLQANHAFSYRRGRWEAASLVALELELARQIDSERAA